MAVEHKIISQEVEVIDLLGRRVTVAQVFVKKIFRLSYPDAKDTKVTMFTLKHGVVFCRPDDEYDQAEGTLRATGRALKDSKTLTEWEIGSRRRLHPDTRRTHFEHLIDNIKQNPSKYFVYGKQNLKQKE